ncbi:hypothetical protein GGR51DRAFT_567882 [Nemania sp. FL0031]|nr:hypothetical protein GGR51DRAFT_567882 [Nemania sp. FL0031]
MPPHKSSSEVPPRAAAKPRARKSARPEEAEPTPAQKLREERKEKLRIAKFRQDLYRERPSQLEDDGFIVETTLFPKKRPAYPSYDESPKKRRKGKAGKAGKELQAEKRARRAPWEKDARLKKPPPPPDSPVGTFPRDQDPIDALGRFSQLPTEIRDEILRYILLWPHEIAVFSGWGRVFPRSRPRLDLAVMYTCRVLRDQGLSILFGENTFTYDSRDPVASHGHTNPVMEKVFGNSVVPINEHGHLIRYIKIKVHRSRVHFSEHRQTFESAILKFLPGGGLTQAANLHTLTLEVPAECNRDLQSTSKTRRADEVPICQYLRNGSRISDALFKLRVQWVRVLAWDKFGECWETKVDMRNFVKDEQMRLEYMTLNGEKHSSADGDNDLNIPRDPIAADRYRTKDVEAMQKRWDDRVKNAVGKLRSLAWRIEGLALDPDRAIYELGLWKHVTPPKGGGPGSDDRRELASLPSDYHEHSYSTRSSSGRSRKTAARSSANIKSTPKAPTGSHIKAGVRAKASPGQLTIFQGKDTAAEARLLQAQQSTRENGMGSSDKGMLTAEWLENLEEPDDEDTGEPVINYEAEANTVEVELHENSK